MLVRAVELAGARDSDGYGRLLADLERKHREAFVDLVPPAVAGELGDAIDKDLAATLRSAGPAGRTFNYQSINTQVLAEVLFPTGYCGTSTALPTRSRGRVHPAGSRALPSRSAFRQKAAPRRCDRRRTPPEDSISFHEERPSIAFVKTPPRGVDQSELSDLNDLTGVFERVAGGFGLSSDRVRFSTKCGGWLGRHPA